MYCLVQDNDSHWYIIEETLKEAFYKWVDDCENDKSSSYNFVEYRIDSPFNIRFETYKEI